MDLYLIRLSLNLFLKALTDLEKEINGDGEACTHSLWVFWSWRCNQTNCVKAEGAARPALEWAGGEDAKLAQFHLPAWESAPSDFFYPANNSSRSAKGLEDILKEVCKSPGQVCFSCGSLAVARSLGWGEPTAPACDGGEVVVRRGVVLTSLHHCFC